MRRQKRFVVIFHYIRKGALTENTLEASYPLKSQIKDQMQNAWECKTGQIFKGKCLYSLFSH